MDAAVLTPKKRGLRLIEIITLLAVVSAMVCVHLMFFFWPFRYRQVHPLLEKVFESRVEVTRYYRTYFPHPGFVAEDIRFYRHGDKGTPALATVRRMTVAGQWGMLIFHPHQLYEIRLEGLHVQIPPPGTKARGMDFDNGVVDTSQSKMRIETIVADGAKLDFLRKGDSPIRFNFAALQIHDLRQGKPMQFSLRVITPGPQGTVTASGAMGPFRTSSYATTPLSGNYTMTDADLSRVDGVAGHVAAGGHFSGTFSKIEAAGTAAIPDFRAGGGHTVRMDAEYHVTVNATNADVSIENAQVKFGKSVITASGSVAGSPRKVAVTIAAKDAQLVDLLKIVEASPPQVEGDANFNAAVEFGGGPGRFLQRLLLKGDVSLERMRFTKPETQQTMDAFSARVRKDPSEDAKPSDAAGAPAEPAQVSVSARSQTRFEQGMAYFPDIHASVPGADAHLHGTFNLLDTRIHLTGTVALEKSLSHAVTGWKAMLLKPVSPLFRKKDAGAVAPIAVTGTARKPKLGADLFHDK
jgi:hypothetical protein